jgi:hypothetical protein
VYFHLVQVLLVREAGVMIFEAFYAIAETRGSRECYLISGFFQSYGFQQLLIRIGGRYWRNFFANQLHSFLLNWDLFQREWMMFRNGEMWFFLIANLTGNGCFCELIAMCVFELRVKSYPECRWHHPLCWRLSWNKKPRKKFVNRHLLLTLLD